MVRDAVLVRPAAAPGFSNAAIINARSSQIWKKIIATCRGCTKANVDRNVRLLIDRYNSFSVDVASRSLPVTGFDVASALVAAGISTTASVRWDSAELTIDPKTVGQLSDGLWLRIGRNDLSPASIAYADEYCGAYPGEAQTGTDPVKKILAGPASCGSRVPGPVNAIKPVSCLISGVDDASAPAVLAETWPVRDDGAHVRSRNPKHWFTDVRACMKDKN
ncbi:hypothetical protein [Actinoplanes siamensis]|uniref:Uncharacterized protein n=1 Tax=Actinoplanes siamensis TaxID=1223317 RepID=A0A919N3Y2_9ACTN|nr:hypothetical protein [Actinoplanes siamensis]GIF03941.1 hypothetical protein Asi03nite_14790 [Actinoplanes siamensis]